MASRTPSRGAIYVFDNTYHVTWKLHINREENADKAFRQRYPQFSHTPSSRLNAGLQSTTQQMLSAHETAKQHDANMAYNLQDSQFLEQMRLLGLSKVEITDMLPNASPSSARSRCDTSKLESHLASIAKLFERREEILQELRAKASEDCSDSLMDEYNRYMAGAGGVVSLSEDTKSRILDTQVSPLQVYMGKLQETLQQQHEILQKVHEENILFNNARENDPATQERDQIMRTFEQGISSFFATHSQLNAGITFYRDMQVRAHLNFPPLLGFIQFLCSLASHL